ncbi:MAG: adenylosuccinate lyase [Candidatus Odinarchaeia archaeon]
MPVHPIEYRYYYEEMRNIFTEENKLQKWLDVEAALARAHAKLGNIPKEAADEITRKASIKYVKLERVKEIDKQIHHDLMAMVKAFSEVCEGDAGKYIHLGATSYDTEDTALALQLRDAIRIIKKDLVKLREVLINLAEAHKETICIGRTHGQHALPTTYGMKFAIWAYEVDRHIARLDECKDRVLVGKMSGAVGTMASFGEKGFEIQELVMKELGLKPAEVSNQVVQRDRLAELMLLLALIAASLNKFAKEIRNLQRTEIGEVYEPFGKSQVGSSTMPHKRNPHKSERICGLYRVVASYVFPALEDVGLEHERDLTNSSVERIIIPESFILLDFMLRQMIFILEGLEFNYDNIKRNLDLTRGLYLAEKVMIELVKKGLGRQEAHEALRRCAVKCWSENKTFKQAILEDEVLSKFVSEDELDNWLDPKNYLGTAIQQVERAVKDLRGKTIE